MKKERKYNSGYIACGKTKLYANVIIDTFNEVDNSTWIYTLKKWRKAIGLFIRGINIMASLCTQCSLAEVKSTK